MQTRSIFWSDSYQVLALLALGFLLLLAAFWDGITELVTRCDKQEEYSLTEPGGFGWTREAKIT
jgi:hypothetical protein